MKIYYSKTFVKEYKKLPKDIKLLAERREIIFRRNPFDPRLKTHKLKGRLKEFYSFSIAYNWRIVFHFIDDETVGFDRAGSHAVYR